MTIKKVFLIIIDSVGVGEMPDASEYGDEGAHTLGNIARENRGLKIPTLSELGIGNITPLTGVNPTKNPLAVHTKMAELSVGKDTLTGHWELMGLHVTTPFQVFTDTGFPKELIDELKKQTGRDILGNKAASGTEILAELGEEHMKTGALIVYTSADSVLQIAAHESIIPIDELYEISEIARKLTLQPQWMVGRVIARPFIGEDKHTFKRTSNRHDYALKPHGKTVLNHLKDNKLDVISLGKINDIYNGEGITQASKTVSNADGMAQITDWIDKDFHGLCYLNLVDFDALYGHRRDVKGYAKSIEEFDSDLSLFISKMKDSDLLIITADHGNDPTHEGTDHTREYVPLLVYQHQIIGKHIDIRQSFADVGATIADIFGVKSGDIGISFLSELTTKKGVN